VDHGCRVDQGFQMNDTHRIVKTVRLHALPSSKGLAVANRITALQAHHPIGVYFAAAADSSTAAGNAAVAHSQLKTPELPPNVHLHTFRTSLGADLRCSPFPPRQCDPPQEQAGPINTVEVLVRLQHFLSAQDDPGGLSKPASVDLAAWLATWGQVLRIDETTLTAAEVIRADTRGSIALHPMQLRTFLVTLKPLSGLAL
jgi:hypothetical protein